MAKYIGSPWGKLRGKLNGAVGGSYKGIDWARVHFEPHQRGTLQKYIEFKDGLPGGDDFSFPQFNLRRVVIGPLGFVARSNLTNWIHLVWEQFCERKLLKMSGSNLWIKLNSSRFLNSMPHKEQEYNPATNAPDMLTLKTAWGDLEQSTLASALYDKNTGDLGVTWTTGITGNGKATDKVYLIIMKLPLIDTIGRDGNWLPALSMYGPLEIAGKTRSNGSGSVTIPEGLENEDLTAYFFLRDATNQIGFSQTTSLAVDAI